METGTIFLTKTDLERLQHALLEQRDRGGSRRHLSQLKQELERAVVVNPEEIPADVITMHSTFELTDLETGETAVHTLVFPEEAGKRPQNLSVLAPIGMAALGYRVGDEFRWEVPAGTRVFRVSRVIYQPEAAGDLRG